MSTLQSMSRLSIVFEKSKSELLHLSKKRQAYLEPLHFEEFLLEPKTSVKWLGIWPQYTLSFKNHVEKRLHLAQGALQRPF